MGKAKVLRARAGDTGPDAAPDETRL
jgi:hypothetical protein